MKSRLSLLVLAGVLALFGGLTVWGAQIGFDALKDPSNPLSPSVPSLISMQGRLADPSDGTPYAGTKSVQFKMFDADTGGIELWTETQVLSLDPNGFFDAQLGSVNPLPPTLADPLYVEMIVEGETLSPRTRITSSAFALSAGNGVPSGTTILSESPTAPSGYTAAGTMSTGDEWEWKTAIASRYDMVVESANDKVYVLGGSFASSPFGTTPSVVEYDPATNTSTTKASMSVGRYGSAGAVVNGKIYVIGGITVAPTTMNTVEEYNPVADSWTTKTPMPTARFSLQAVVANGKIYAIGGNDGSSLSTVEEYNPATDTWTTKEALPTIRTDAAAVEFQGKIYVIGGTGNGNDPVATISIYDPATDSWSTAAPMPSPRAGVMSAVVSGDSIYMQSNYNWGSWFMRYDPASSAWSSRDWSYDLGFNFGLAVVGNKIYGVEHSSGGSPSDIIEYTPETIHYLYKKD